MKKVLIIGAIILPLMLFGFTWYIGAYAPQRGKFTVGVFRKMQFGIMLRSYVFYGKVDEWDFDNRDKGVAYLECSNSYEMWDVVLDGNYGFKEMVNPVRE